MTPPLRRAPALLLLVLTLALAGCSPRLLIVRGVADQLAGQGQAAEDDVLLARDASAFYLKLSESVLRQDPGHLALAEAVAGGFTQYAYAFIAFEAERLETEDAKAAQKIRERARRMYQRANRHALAALDVHHPGIAKALTNEPPMLKGKPLKLAPEEVGVAYWAAASWGATIALSKDDPEAVADLPLAIRLASLAYAVNPDYGAGALVSLMGTYETVRPMGSKAKAEMLFDRAITLGKGVNAAAFVTKAEAVALPAGDKVAFEALLRQALAASDAKRDLANEVMRTRAQWLLDTIDDRF